MRRRMPILIVALFTIIGFTGVALASCTGPSCVYVPIASIERTATPIPTPIPPALSSLVIQLSEMKSGFSFDTFREMTNADAAKNYKDQKGALKAFQAQGRESSWYAIYTSTDYLFTDALIVSSQVTRYLTTDGAVQGFLYSVGKSQQDHPDYRQFNVTAPCCGILGFRRTFTEDNLTVDQFDILVQYGRYTSEVQMIALTGVGGPELAVYYTNIPLGHLLATPQATQNNEVSRPAQQPPVAVPPSLDLLRVALTPR